jgi:putative transposase
MLADSLMHRDNMVYELDAFCIMLNHVHMVFKPLENTDGINNSLSTIMHSLKRYTARQANLLLGQSGSFWQHESYDHVIRDESELEQIIKYVLYNPVKAGLVNDWSQWRWSYCKYEF